MPTIGAVAKNMYSGGRIKYLPPLPLSAPSRPASSSGICQVVTMLPLKADLLKPCWRERRLDTRLLRDRHAFWSTELPPPAFELPIFVRTVSSSAHPFPKTENAVTGQHPITEGA